MLQPLALSLLKSGRNVFLTGQAGSGKTYVINQYVRWLWSCGIQVAITASTGIAATHIGGVTIHSWSGTGIKDHLSDHDMELLQQKEHLHKNITKAKVLIIDEISMLSANTIDMVDRVVKMIRRDGRAFGGMQVIFVGDFFQLPPVMKMNPDGTESNKRFAFAANARKEANLTMCYLHTQHRQEVGDFGTLLNELRKGEISKPSLQLLQTRTGNHIQLEHAVKLYTHNMDVDRINIEKLDALEGDQKSFLSQGAGEKMLVDALKKSMLAPEVLALKIGAQVIFVKNNPQKGYFNGTTGEIVKFDERDGYPVVKIKDGTLIKAELETRSVENANEIVAAVKQIPLKLAWAITVHKSQGMTLDAAEMDLSKVFEPGQAYVALSRVKSLEGLKLLGINEFGLKAHPLVLRADAYFEKQSEEIVASNQYQEASIWEQIHKKFIETIGGFYQAEIIEQEKSLIPKAMKATKPKVEKGDSVKQTLVYVRQGKNLEEIVEARGLAASTIRDHIFKIHHLHPEVSLKAFKPEDMSLVYRIQKICGELDVLGTLRDENDRIKLKPIFDAMNGDLEYNEIRRAMLFI